MRLLSLLLLAALSVLPAGARAQTVEPFGRPTTTSISRLDVLSYLFIKQDEWTRVRRQTSADDNKVFACEQVQELCTPEAQWFLQLARAASLMQGVERLEWLNHVIHRTMIPTSDWDAWKQREHWSPYLDTLGRWGRGDCEDYALLAKAILEKAGMTSLRVLAVKIVPRRPREIPENIHAVLAIPLDGSWYLLDYLQPVRKDTKARNYKPLFVFDEQGVRKYLPPASLVAELQPTAR